MFKHDAALGILVGHERIELVDLVILHVPPGVAISTVDHVLTRGWHFTDMAGYRAAMIESWAEQRGEEDAAGIGFRHLAGSKPRPLTAVQRERFLDFTTRP